VVFPRHLLLEKNGHAAYFDVLPRWLNREARRDWSSRLRRNGAVRGLGSTSPDKVFLAWFKQRGSRFTQFWRLVERYETEGAQASQRVLSLDYSILEQAFPGFLEADVKRDLIEKAYAGLSDLEQRIAEEYPDVSKVLHVLSLWLPTKERLEKWNAVSDTEREALANAVFALCGVSDSWWFLEEAEKKVPAISELFDEEIPRDGGPTPASEVPEVQDSVGEWRRTWTEVSKLGTRAAESEPTVSHLDELVGLSGELEALREAVKSRLVAQESVEEVIGSITHLLSEAAERHKWLSLDSSAVDQIASRWHAEAARADDGGKANLLRNAHRRVDELPALLGQAEQEFKSLSVVEDRIAELAKELEKTRTPAERRSLLDQRNRADEEQLKLLDAVQRIETQVLDCALPFKLASDPVRGEVNAPTAMDGFTPENKRADHAGAAEQVKVEGVERDRVDQGPQPTAPPAGPDVAASAQAQKSPIHVEPNEEPRTAGGPASVPTAPSPLQEPWTDDAFSIAAGRRCGPIWAALLEGRLALAFHISKALEETEPTMVVPHPPLVRAVALANHVQSTSGRIARELEELYARFDPAWFKEGPTAWSQGLNLLLVAATLNPALIAPSTGASAVLRYRHLAGNLNSLYSLCELVIEYGERLQGQSLNPSAFRGHKSMEAWKREIDGLKEEITEWRTHAPRMTMKFAPATAVWQRWQRSDGTIGRVLDKVLNEDVADMDAVARSIKPLQYANDFKELVTRTDRHELKRRRGDDIHAGALTQLRERTGEALAFVQRWLELMEARPSHSDYMARQLGELRQEAVKLKAPLGRELAELASGAGQEWALIPAGVACVRRSVQVLEGLLDGSQQLREPEPTPDTLVGNALLLAPSVDVDESLNPLQSAQELLPHLLKLASGTEDWIGSFKERLTRGDCSGAKRIIELPGVLPEEELAKLSQLFQSELDHHRERLRAALKQARDELEAALAYGYVDEHERSELDAILVEVDHGFENITRFDDVLRRIGQVSKRIQSARETKLGAVQETYRALRLAADSDASVRLQRIINQGDVLTANEYLARLRAGESLPSADEDGRDIFADFFPAKARSIDSFLEAPGGGLGSVVNLIKRGQGFGGLSFGGITGAQTKSAAEMAEAWQRLKRTERIDEANLTGVLSGIGFSNPRVKVTSVAKSECEVQAERLADRSTCPVPQYGSQAGGHYRVVCIFKRLTDEDLVRFVSETSGARATLVLYFGRLKESRRRELAQVSREKRRTFLVLDEILLLYLASEPKSRLAAFFQCALPFTFVEPYITTSGLVPPEMFYGRVDELNAVRDMSGRCFIYGGRQLGKTALLREAERSFHSPAEQRVARWIDLKAEGIGMSREPHDIWYVVQRELKDAGVTMRDASARKVNSDAISEDIRKWLGINPSRRILLLLDEADRFLEQDSRLQYPETSRLKNLMDVTGRRFKVVFAGLHNVLRTTEQANHPLAHLGDPIEIGPLLKAGEWRYARELIRFPLAIAGYTFEPDDLMVRILAQTNYYPSLIQLYCAQLLRQLHKPYSHRLDYRNGPRYGISDAVVDETYRSKELRDAIRSRFHLTLQLDPRYEVVTYAIAYAIDQGRMSFEEGADSKSIREYALQWWAEGFRGTSEHEFRVLLDEMVALGVLRHSGERSYSLRNPNILLLMGTREDIEASLLRDREPPQEFEPNLYRAHLPGDSHDVLRSPLTFGQEHALVRKENGVTLITGSLGAGLDSLEKFLNARVPAEFLRLARSPITRDEFLRQLDLLERRPEGGTTLHVISPAVPWDVEWVRLAVARVERLRAPDRHVRMVFVADPGRLNAVLPQLRPLMDGLAVELIELKPWGDNFLRQWLEDIGITGADFESRRRLADATGLWPSLILETASAAAGTDIAKLCLAAERMLENPEGKRKILHQIGLGGGQEEKVLQVLGELGELAEDEFGEYREFFESAPDIVLRTLEWAEALHLAERTSARTWRVSPFVARVLKAAEVAHGR
jgi:hypothetical protein